MSTSIRIRRIITAAVAAGSVAALLSPVLVRPVTAAAADGIVACELRGTLDAAATVFPGYYTWTLNLDGRCVDAQQREYAATLSGHKPTNRYGGFNGDTAGIYCDVTGHFVSNLPDFIVALTLTDDAGQVTRAGQYWTLPAFAAPESATPVVISTIANDANRNAVAGTPIGAGALATRIAGACPDGPNSRASAYVTFVPPPV